MRFFWIFWILRIFHNEYMHKPWSPAILGTGNSFETWWWYWHSGLIMNIGLSDDIMRFEKVILTLHLKVFYIKSVYKHMELCEYENYNWPNIRDKRLSNGKLFSIFSQHWKKTFTENIYMIDQEKTGFESSKQVMNALKLLNSPYLPSNQRYESYLLLMSYRIVL